MKTRKWYVSIALICMLRPGRPGQRLFVGLPDDLLDECVPVCVRLPAMSFIHLLKYDSNVCYTQVLRKCPVGATRADLICLLD